MHMTTAGHYLVSGSSLPSEKAAEADAVWQLGVEQIFFGGGGNKYSESSGPAHL